MMELLRKRNFERFGISHPCFFFENKNSYEDVVYVDLGLSRKWSKTVLKGKDRLPIVVSWKKLINLPVSDKLVSHIPTRDELTELLEKCKWQWNERRHGFDVTGPNGNKIFVNTTDNTCTHLWSKTVYEKNGRCYYYMCVSKDGVENSSLDKKYNIDFTGRENGFMLLLVD